MSAFALGAEIILHALLLAIMLGAFAVADGFQEAFAAGEKVGVGHGGCLKKISQSIVFDRYFASLKTMLVLDGQFCTYIIRATRPLSVTPLRRGSC